MRKWIVPCSFGCLILGLATVAHAEPVSFSAIMLNLSRSYPALIKFITGFAYVTGIALFLRALYYLKVYGTLRTRSPIATDIRHPIMCIFVGAVFIYLPTAVHIFIESAFGSGTIISYEDWSGAQSFGNPVIARTVGVLVQILGLITFMKGCMGLTKPDTGPKGLNQGTSKALVQIIGGVLAMNVYAFAELLSNTVGKFFSYM